MNDLSDRIAALYLLNNHNSIRGIIGNSPFIDNRGNDGSDNNNSPSSYDDDNRIYLKGATMARDFELEATFTEMARQWTRDYAAKYWESVKSGIKPLTPVPGFDTSYYDYMQQEKDYYYNKNRFPDPIPLYDAANPPPFNVDKNSFQYGLWCEKYNPEHPNCGCDNKF